MSGTLGDSEKMNKDVMCRLCLNNHEHYLSIFIPNEMCRISLWCAIEDLLSLEVADGDGLPATVCRHCVRKLEEFSDFKEMCIKSAAVLRKYPSVNDIKSHMKEDTGSCDVIEGKYVENWGGGSNDVGCDTEARADSNIMSDPLALEEHMSRMIEDTGPCDVSKAENVENWGGENVFESDTEVRTDSNIMSDPLAVEEDMCFTLALRQQPCSLTADGDSGNKNGNFKVLGRTLPRDETIKENLDCYPKRKRNLDMCLYCKTSVLNFHRHIQRNHPDESEVQKILSLKKKSVERKRLFASLRKKGNFLLSLEGCVVRPVKKCSLSEVEMDYLPCAHCLGYYVRTQLCQHEKKCVENRNNSNGSRCQVEAQNL